MHSIKTKINPSRELKAKLCSLPWVRARQIIEIKKKRETCGLSYPQTSGCSRRGRTIHSHTHAAKPKHIARYFLSSEAQAVPPGRQCHQREHEAGTACPCRSHLGWLVCSRTQAVLYPKRRFSCWRLNCRSSSPAVNKCCPDGKRELGRGLPLFPCSCNRTGRKTTVLCLNARYRCTNELSTRATASNWPEKRCCFSTSLKCVLGGRELSNIFTRNLSQSQGVKPTRQTVRRLQHLQAVCSVRAS